MGQPSGTPGALVPTGRELMPANPPAQSVGMDKDPKQAWSDDTDWDTWFQEKFSDAMQTFASTNEQFKNYMLELLRSNHENLRTVMGQHIVGGLEKLCVAIGTQNAADRAEIATGVENVIQISIQNAVAACERHADTQILHFQQQLDQELGKTF